jgi:hypothetical protein
MNVRAIAATLLLILAVPGLSAQECTILLLAGTMQPIDHAGHHDYQGGILVLHDCLVQTPGIHVTMSTTGWPEDGHELDDAQSVVFYCDGGGKQPYLATAERIAAIDAMVARGVGLVLIHQAIDHPPEQVTRAIRWMGGSYDPAVSSRGHWSSEHSEFPSHAITNGVTPWSINDGWLCNLRFAPGMQGVTPLVWSSKIAHGSPTAGAAAITSWGCERPAGGRSFTFTGLDGHDAWKRAGVRQLVTNGVLWSANMPIPPGGAPCVMDDAAIDHHMTRRGDVGQLLIR